MMKYALVNEQLTTAAADAQSTATCPNCEGVVELRNRQDTWFWRHIQLPRGACQPERAADSVMEESGGDRWIRQVGDIVVEPHPDERHLALRSLSAGEVSELCQMTIPLSEVRQLAQVLLDAMEEVIEGKQ